MKKVLALEKEYSRLGGKGESAEPTFFFLSHANVNRGRVEKK